MLQTSSIGWPEIVRGHQSLQKKIEKDSRSEGPTCWLLPPKGELMERASQKIKTCANLAQEQAHHLPFGLPETGARKAVIGPARSHFCPDKMTTGSCKRNLLSGIFPTHPVDLSGPST